MGQELETKAAPVVGILTIFQLVWEIVKGVKWLAQFIQENREERWFQDSAALFSELRQAETREQRQALAARMRDLIAGLGK